jgi:hypothetical protein
MPNTTDAGQHPDHRVRSGLSRLFQTCQAGLFDGLDLLAYQAQPGQVALHFVERVRWDRRIFRCAQRLQKLWWLAQLRLEATDAESGQIRLQAIDDARTLADQVFPFTAGPLGVLFLDRRDRDHSAMATFATQPSQEHPHQHGGVEPIRLGPLVLFSWASSGTPLSLPALLPDAIIDGEIVALDENGAADFAALQAALRATSHYAEPLGVPRLRLQPSLELAPLTPRNTNFFHH